ncbi:hypothetical protein [Prevotella jejuni]|uniref:hypothetical protein n=1 Tax=Prevotella jejuni TaxID=1177574 RepID=UPI0028ED0284|nr:hypothetical protein [Prevotella jejuni]
MILVLVGNRCSMTNSSSSLFDIIHFTIHKTFSSPHNIIHLPPHKAHPQHLTFITYHPPKHIINT